MPLDFHLFCDIKEGLARNIACSYWMEDTDADTFRGATPSQIFESVCRTINNKTPTNRRILEDVYRIKEATLQRIVDANGTFIEDSPGKPARGGVRLEAQKDAQMENAIETDPRLRERFSEMLTAMRENRIPVPCMFDYNGEPVEVAESIFEIRLYRSNGQEDAEAESEDEE